MFIAHNFIHRKCLKVAWPGSGCVEGSRQDKDTCFPSCYIIAQWKNSLKNQGSLIWNKPLHTILSTELVQNCTCRNAADLLHCRIRFSSIPVIHPFLFRSSLVRHSSS